jgi:uncharacterized YigZ family protein
MSDHYQTIAGPAEYRQKIERSEFLAIAFTITTGEAFFDALNRIAKEHFDATHHCWAFRLRERSRSSDAGEPSGTAGKPILLAIEAAEVFETAVVVVRWYGGVKLGTGGLSRAYRDTAALALAGAKRLDRFEYDTFEVVVPFDSFGGAYRLVDPPHVILVREDFGEVNGFVFAVRRSLVEPFARKLAELRLAFTRAG